MTMDEAEAREILRGATQPLTPGPRQLVDPPEVARFAQRGDPDISDWPGRLVTRQDLMMASGDPRDWFRYGHRLKAYEQAWHEFVDARSRRKDFMAGFEWNQILVLGDYGSGKTTLATHLARHFFGLGHPVFSNASCLFGWRLEHESMYTALGFMPKASVLLIDESSAALASRMGHSIAVTSFSEMNLKCAQAEWDRRLYVSAGLADCPQHQARLQGSLDARAQGRPHSLGQPR